MARLRLLSLNLWHGLNHTQPRVMLPMENPLARLARKKALLKGLEALKLPAAPDLLQVFSLQEVNPISRESKSLRQALSMEAATADVNVGVRLGPLSYPFFLQEGLATFWQGDLEKAETRALELSGHVPSFHIPWLEQPLSVQLAERRGGLLVGGNFQGKFLVFGNLHLHNGHPDSGARVRRLEELEKLLAELQNLPWRKADAVFLMGDFNSEPEGTEMQMMKAEGFLNLSSDRDPQVSRDRFATWDPLRNPLCRQNAELSLAGSVDRDWDGSVRQFDHILCRPGPGISINPQRAERVFDNDTFGAWVSDHYGLLVDLSF